MPPGIIQLIGKAFSAFRASSLEYISAVSSCHSLSEAVLLLSLSFLGLVCSEHFLHLLDYLFGTPRVIREA